MIKTTMNQHELDDFWTKDKEHLTSWFNKLNDEQKRSCFLRVSEKSKSVVDERLDYFYLPLLRKDESAFYKQYVDYRQDKLHTVRWFFKNVSESWLVENYKRLAKKHNVLNMEGQPWRFPNNEVAASTFAKAIVARFQKMDKATALKHLETLHHDLDKVTRWHLALFLIAKDTAMLREYAWQRYGQEYNLEMFYCFHELKRQNNTISTIEKNHENLARMINRMIDNQQFAIEVGRNMDKSMIDLYIATKPYLNQYHCDDFFHHMLYQRMLKNDKGVIEIIEHLLKKREEKQDLFKLKHLEFILKRAAHVMKKEDKQTIFDLVMQHVEKSHEWYDLVYMVKQSEKKHPALSSYIVQKEYEHLAKQLPQKEEKKRFKV